MAHKVFAGPKSTPKLLHETQDIVPQCHILGFYKGFATVGLERHLNVCRLNLFTPGIQTQWGTGTSDDGLYAVKGLSPVQGLVQFHWHMNALTPPDPQSLRAS